MLDHSSRLVQSRNLCRFGTNKPPKTHQQCSEKETLCPPLRRSSCRCNRKRRSWWRSRWRIFLEHFAGADICPKLIFIAMCMHALRHCLAISFHKSKLEWDKQACPYCLCEFDEQENLTHHITRFFGNGFFRNAFNFYLFLSAHIFWESDWLLSGWEGEGDTFETFVCDILWHPVKRKWPEHSLNASPKTQSCLLYNTGKYFFVFGLWSLNYKQNQSKRKVPKIL